MKCKKFDDWIKSIPVNPRGYTKKSDDFPYLSVFVYAMVRREYSYLGAKVKRYAI